LRFHSRAEAEAAKILEENNLSLKVASKRYSQSVAAGHVLDQNPAAGRTLKASRSVRVLLSAGTQTYFVPDLVGMSVRAANLTLTQRNFTLGNRSITHTASGEPMTIQQQSPLPGSAEGVDPAVSVLLSAGPIEQSFVMPDLVGKPVEQVSARIRAEGFQVGKPTFHKYSGIGAGIVTQQRPQAGHRLSKNDTIALEVSQ